MREIVNGGDFSSLLREYLDESSSIRFGVAACTGSGKSTFLKWILRKILFDKQVWIYTPKRNDGFQGREITSLETMAALIYRNTKGHFLVYDTEMFKEAASLFVAGKGHRILLIDEAHNILTKEDNDYWKIWKKILMEGRGWGLGIIWASLSPSYCDVCVRRNSGGLALGMLPDPTDRKYVRGDNCFPAEDFYDFNILLPKGEHGTINTKECLSPSERRNNAESKRKRSREADQGSRRRDQHSRGNDRISREESPEARGEEREGKGSD